MSRKHSPAQPTLFAEPVVGTVAEAVKPATAIFRSARISPCGLYRYYLGRAWEGQGEGILNLIMLNPSRADADQDDPTIRRCIGFARTWGFAGLWVTNLFAWRATDPDDLADARDAGHDIVGTENDEAILAAAREARMVVCAWGNLGAMSARKDRIAPGRSDEVLALLAGEGIKLHAITWTGAGMPGHPLYLPGASRPEPFEVER